MSAAERWYLEIGERRLELDAGELVIGRDPDCELALDDATVSRGHALLSVSDDRVTLQDLGSSNGTFVNGQRLHGETEVAAGDRLRLGRVRLRLVRGVLEAERRLSRRYCPACGAAVADGAEQCPRCGADVTGDRAMSRSEAVAMSEVMPVGEALARPTAPLQRTRAPFPSPWPGGGKGDGDATPPPRPLPEAGFAPLPEDGGDADDEGEETAGVPRPAAMGAEAAAASKARAVGEATDEALRETRPGDAAVADGLTPAVAALERAADAGAGAGSEDAGAAPLFLPAAGFPLRLLAAGADLLWLAAAGLAVHRLAVTAGAAPRLAAATGAAVAGLVWAAVSYLGWSRSGTTPGKRLFRLYVCDLDGRPGVGRRRAGRRLLACLLSVATAGLGFLRAGLAADRRALHDHLAGTYVARRPATAHRPAAGR